MDFQNYAARETSELIGRLVNETSEKIAGDLQELRQAFELVTGALDAALASTTGPHYKDRVAALVAQLTKQANAEATARADAAAAQARQQAQVTIDKLRQALDAKTAEMAAQQAAAASAAADLKTQIGGLRTDLEAQAAQTSAARAECTSAQEAQRRTEAARADLEATIGKMRTEADAMRAELRGVREQFDAARAETSRISAQRDAESEQGEKVAAALSAVTTELQTVKARNKDLVAEAKGTAEELGKVRRAREELDAARGALQAKLDEQAQASTALKKHAADVEHERDHARAEAKRLTDAGDKAARALEESEARSRKALAEQKHGLRDQANTFLGASLERLLAMHQIADTGATIDQVLAAVVDALATQFPRVALFRVQNNHLEGFRQVGFDLHADISQVLIPRTLDSLVTQAVASAQVESRSGKRLAETTGMPFSGTPEFALALPIVVDGESLAVVYADDCNRGEREFGHPELRRTFAQLLQCQVVPLLGRLVAEAKVIAELDQYAALLVNELEQTYEADEKGGVATSETERRKNLRDNVEYARRVYAQRASAEGPRAAPLFEQHLLSVVESRAATPFGRDIVAVLGGRKKPLRAAKAEAS